MKILRALLLCANVTPVLAGDGAVAQLTQEERNWLRERWRLASPEERLTMRRQFQEMLQALTPDPHSGAGVAPWMGPPPPAPRISPERRATSARGSSSAARSGRARRTRTPLTTAGSGAEPARHGKAPGHRAR